jgi:hypothetical protein
MAYSGPERRKHPRIDNARFVVSYRVFEEGAENVNISQTKNLGLGGMLLTTNREFKPGTDLALEIRLPFDPNPIILVGKVLESRQIIKDLIYDTRLQFLAIDENHRKIINQTVDYYLKRG